MHIKTLRENTVRSIALTCCALLMSTFSVASDLRVNFGEKIDRIGEEAIANNEAPGISIAMAEGDEIIYAKGFGYANLGTQEEATPNHIFRLASVSKQFTSASIMQLVDAGKVNTADPITKYFPDFPPAAQKVHVSHLLQHTSGIGIEGGLKILSKYFHRSENDTEPIPEGYGIVFDFEAGEKFMYSNTAYYLLGIIIEQVSGQLFSDYLQEHIFDPVGMKNTAYGPSDYPTSQFARGYRLDGEEFKDERKFDMSIPFGAGGLVSTVGDLVLWQQALVNGRVVSPESFTRMRETGVLNSGKRFNGGFGIFVGHDNGSRVISHSGNISGFSSALTYFPRTDITIAVQTNLRNGNSREILKRISTALF